MFLKIKLCRITSAAVHKPAFLRFQQAISHFFQRFAGLLSVHKLDEQYRQR